MNIGLAQIIMLSIMMLNIDITLAKHGERYEKEYNFPLTLFAVIMNIGLLTWGGFFS